MNKVWKHLKTITYHKILVARGCFKVGLYRQGIMHDLSKYSPTEFGVGIRYFQGTRSPNNAEREDIGYSSAWLHHKGRNKHHYEYWVDYSMHIPGGMSPVAMPDKYVAEMVTGLPQARCTRARIIRIAVPWNIWKVALMARLCTLIPRKNCISS